MKAFMKTKFVRQISLGSAAGLIFFLGCARPSAQPEPSKAIVTSTPVNVTVAQAGPAAPVAGEAVEAPPGTNAPAIVERIPPSTKPENVATSPGLSEVVKLAQAGVGEDVILAYVAKYPSSFNIGSDQILYLNDLGVSEAVITSMLKHDGNTASAVASAPSTAQPQALPNQPPQTQVAEQVTPPLVPTGVAPPSASTEVSYFYDTLSPYGSWIYLSGYGWCWQPTVAVSVSSWRPYCDRGRWYYSDAGWYWNSDYSWGWAAFHYGRWYHHPGCGWVWTPGVEWAPSWVSWRYSDGYCGWAPLPPEARFIRGSGFTYFGRHVSVGFEFGLTDFHYAFVDIGHFCDPAPYRHFVPRTTVRNVYRNTTVINNYIVGNNNTVINRGIGRETIARSSQTRIREVSVRETPVQNLASVRGDRIQRQGNQTVVLRPELPKTPPPVKTATFVNHSGGQRSTTVGRSTTAGSAATHTQPATVGRAQPEIGASRVTSVTPETRRGRPVENPQPNTGVSTAQKTVPNANPPRSQPQVQQQQHGNRSLFGDSGANPSPQHNTTTARAAEPRTAVPPLRPQPNYNGSVAPLPRSESRNNNSFPSMSPRGYEQVPRSVTPPSAPVHTPQSSGGSVSGGARSESRQSPASSGGGSHGGGRGDAGSGRSDRSGKNH